MRRALFACALLASTATAQPLAPKPASGLYLGADLSYVNEMEDCGAVFRARGKPVDPFVLMKAEGGNIVRVRIWNDAKWTRYSDLADVTKTIRRAKAAGMQVLLDFHYSDDWRTARSRSHRPRGRSWTLRRRRRRCMRTRATCWLSSMRRG